MENEYCLKSVSNTTYPLNKVLVSIGSLGDVQITDTLPELLPRHCSLIVCNESWGRCVCNLSTAAPVKVNGQVIQDKCELHVGDKIDVCGKEFIFCLNSKKQSLNRQSGVPTEQPTTIKQSQQVAATQSQRLTDSNDTEDGHRQSLRAQSTRAHSEPRRGSSALQGSTSQMEELSCFTNMDDDDVFIDDNYVPKTQTQTQRDSSFSVAYPESSVIFNDSNNSDDQPFIDFD